MLARQPRAIYSLEHEQFRETLHRFFRDEVEPNIKEWEKAGVFSPDLFKTAAKYGILQAGIPEEYGGMVGGLTGGYSHGDHRAAAIHRPVPGKNPGQQPHTRESSIAKLKASETEFSIMDRCLQLHGKSI